MADRLTPERDGRRVVFPRGGASGTIDAGVMVMRSEDGEAVAAFEQAGRTVFGVALARTVAGDAVAECATGVFRFDNSSSDAVSLFYIGALCFVEDKHTVKASGLTRAGVVFELDDSGVWVEIGPRTRSFPTT